MDADINREIERGGVIVKIELDPNEVAQARRPPPCFLRLHRETFIFNVFSIISDFFAEYVAPSMGRPNTLVLVYERHVLPWYFSVGVIHDIFVGKSNGQPFSLTASTMTNPLIPNPTLPSFQTSYMGLLKLAEYITHGSISAINDLDRKKLLELRTVAEKGDSYLNFHDYVPLILPTTPTPTYPKNVAVRLHFFNTTTQATFTRLTSTALNVIDAPPLASPALTPSSSFISSTKTNSPFAMSMVSATVRELLIQELGVNHFEPMDLLVEQFQDLTLLPEHTLPQDDHSKDPIDSACFVEESSSSPQLSKVQSSNLKLNDGIEVLFAGVDVPLDAMLIELLQLGSVDGMVHLIIRANNDIVGGASSTVVVGTS
eukprot:GDKJ01023741.1.p1 GENE.GDKJ01023741.1~~GDKJ01023741.1.p1  ORF type:complete len:372 (-),score=73.18 GDKJ01023741.1:105-1220(-)